MKTITVEVTQEDIDNAGNKHPLGKSYSSKCPVGRALCRTFNSACEAYECDCKIPPLKGWIKLPESATEFINTYDHSLSVFPFSFQLEIPD